MSDCKFCGAVGKHSMEQCRDRLYIMYLQAIDFIKRSGDRIDAITNALEKLKEGNER